MLLFFLLLGRTLEHAMRRKTRAVAGNLAALKGETAHRFAGDELVSVPVAALAAGDRVLLRAGERVPADGVVLSGHSEIDESVITGETARRVVAAGATVYAGSINYAGTLTLKVGRRRRHCADRRNRTAAGESREREVTRHAARRPRLAHLCAAGACHGGADVAGWLHRRRKRSRCASSRRLPC